MGGHYSKSHPGSSKNYNHKMLRRQERAKERDFLKKTKEWYVTQFGDDHIKEDRQTVTKIKVAMLNGEKIVRDKYLKAKYRKQALP